MLTCMDADPNVNIVRIHVDKALMTMPPQSVVALNWKGLHDGHDVVTDFDIKTQEYVLIQRMTGKKMLETLQTIFMELDKMGVPMASVFTCPHGKGIKHDIMYMGRRLQFCDHCHDEVVLELGKIERRGRPVIWDGSAQPIAKLEVAVCM